jgi:hypothetical protein
MYGTSKVGGSGHNDLWVIDRSYINNNNNLSAQLLAAGPTGGLPEDGQPHLALNVRLER